MSDSEKIDLSAEEAEIAVKKTAAPEIPPVQKPPTAEENVEKWVKGKLILETPIRDGKETVTELLWDFRSLTGAEFVDALDGAGRNANTFLITNTQAFHLFAAAAAKATGGIDATDLIQRMGVQDAQIGTQVAMLFSSASFLVANKRISRK